MSAPGERPVDLALAREHGLTDEEWARILEILGRAPSWSELGVFSVMWSEHCSYKSSKCHLRKLPTRGEHVLQGPGENAGAVAIGDGLAVVFKIESHNHPSFIEPKQGAATGVGGILRDVFTMGARPIASLDSIRFGPLDDPKHQQLLRGECMRGKFRKSLAAPEPFEPGKAEAVDYEMPDVLHTFRKGHRIMVQIQSTWFPLVDRNPQTFTDIYAAKASDFKKATQRVHRSKALPSGVELGLLP